MVQNPQCKPYFHDWQTIPNFSANGDTWTAPSDGYVNIVVADMSTSTEYVYLLENSDLVPCCSLMLLTGANGGTFTNGTTVKKGNSYRLSTNISTSNIRFRAFDV